MVAVRRINLSNSDNLRLASYDAEVQVKGQSGGRYDTDDRNDNSGLRNEESVKADRHHDDWMVSLTS